MSDWQRFGRWRSLNLFSPMLRCRRTAVEELPCPLGDLAPADLPKEGGRFDLPIALAVLAGRPRSLHGGGETAPPGEAGADGASTQGPGRASPR